MYRPGWALLAATGLCAFLPSAADAQTPADRTDSWSWVFKVSVDKMTDRDTLTASLVAEPAPGSGNLYQLRFVCDGATREATVLTAQTPGGTPRPIPWESVDTPYLAADRLIATRTFRYRIDDEDARGGTLRQRNYVNVGALGEVFGDMTSPGGPFASLLEDELRKDFGKGPRRVVPRARLLLSDIFPDETVEFSFAALTEAQRSELTYMCFREEEEARIKLVEEARVKAAAEAAEKAAFAKRVGEANLEGVYRPGEDGTTSPVLINPAPGPNYTAGAQRAQIQGSVVLEAVVLPDGSVGPVWVIRSLDSKFGLDDEAVRTAKLWRFKPGTKGGVPVAVVVVIEMDFTLR